MEEEVGESTIKNELARVSSRLLKCKETRREYRDIIANTRLSIKYLRYMEAGSEQSLRIVEELASCYQKLSKALPFYKKPLKSTELKKDVKESAPNTIRNILNKVYSIDLDKLVEDRGTSDALVDLLETKARNEPISFRVVSTHIGDLEHPICGLTEQFYDSERGVLVKSSVGWEFSSAAFGGGSYDYR